MEDEAGLTPREVDVVRLMACGLTDKEIAARLGVKSHTASNCVSLILLKLGAANRTQAVAEAFRRGILQADE